MTEDPYIVKIEHGKVRVVSRKGDLKRQFCGNAESAELVGEELHVLLKNGVKRVYDING